MKKKIAIIGSSPIMLIIAKVLLKNNLVTIFEKINPLEVLGK